MATKKVEQSQVFVWYEDEWDESEQAVPCAYWDESELGESEQAVPCVWHQPGKDPNGSHGICKDCAHELKMQHKARKAVKALFQKGK